MKAAFRALLALAAGVAGAPSCSAPSPGELMIVVQTDMSLPKDIDTIRLEVSVNGTQHYDQNFEGLGNPGAVRLPATLGLLPPEDPSTPVTIRVSARRGGRSGEVRVLREVVTTVPSDRIAMLPIPLQFLCDGSGEDKDGRVESTCPTPGETCIAGTCGSREVDSTKLPPYASEQIFGGGTGKGDGSCFNVALCFEGGTTADVDLATCSLDPIEGAANVSLKAQDDGICGAAGCFIALDAESAVGFITAPDGRRKLPSAVCEQLMSGKLLGVVTASVTDVCPQKTSSLPTCGPWSSAGSDGSSPPKLPWIAAASMSISRYDHSAALLPDGRVLVAGGNQNVAAVVVPESSAEIYDPTSGTWSPTSPMATGRMSFAMVSLPNGNVLVAGGDSTKGIVATAELFDPATETWSPAASMSAARAFFPSVLLKSGKVLVAGGLADGGPVVAAAEIFDPATDMWTSAGSLAAGTYEHEMVLLASGEVLALGGRDDTYMPLASAYLYDPAVNSWMSGPPMAYAHADFRATRLLNGLVLLTGGPTELFDPMKGVWTTAAQPAKLRSFPTATLLENGKVLVAGNSEESLTAEIYAPSTDTWADAGGPLERRYSHTATKLPDGRVLIAGGLVDGKDSAAALIFNCNESSVCATEP